MDLQIGCDLKKVTFYLYESSMLHENALGCSILHIIVTPAWLNHKGVLKNNVILSIINNAWNKDEPAEEAAGFIPANATVHTIHMQQCLFLHLGQVKLVISNCVVQYLRQKSGVLLLRFVFSFILFLLFFWQFISPLVSENLFEANFMLFLIET